MNFGVVVAVVVVFVVVVVSYQWVADLNVLIAPDLITFFRAFKAVIGNLDELRKKDYGDEERGARRLESWLWKLFLSFSVYLSETELLSLKTAKTVKSTRERDFIFSANFFPSCWAIYILDIPRDSHSYDFYAISYSCKWDTQHVSLHEMSIKLHAM